MIAEHFCVLNARLGEHLCALVKEIFVDPARWLPVLVGNELVSALCFCHCLGFLFEFLGEWDIVEECPWVVELAIPCSFEIFHRLKDLGKFLVTNEGEEGCIDAVGIGIVGCIIVTYDSVKRSSWLIGSCEEVSDDDGEW